MKIVSDKATRQFLSLHLTQKYVLEELQPCLMAALVEYAQTPSLIPPRTVVSSNCTENTHLFMPCVGPKHLGVKVVTGGPYNNAKGISFVGPIVVMEESTGETMGLVNAKTVTAFRTALATSIAMVKVLDPKDDELNLLPEVTVFGAGSQARWHVELALALYGLKKVNIVNRSLANATAFVDEMKKDHSDVEFVAHELAGVTKEILENSSIIFGCTPATEPIILASQLNQDPAFRKFIGLIGSYKPHMIELDLEYINNSIKGVSKIMVDLKEHTLAEAGELIQSGIEEDGLAELTELTNIDAKEVLNKDNVAVLKVVGLSIMDIAIAKLLLETGVGQEVEEF